MAAAARSGGLRSCSRGRPGGRVRVATRGFRGAVCAASGLNPNVAKLRPSKTVALTDLARELQAEGRDVVSLTAGEPDFDTPGDVARAGVRAIEEGKTHYAPNAGTAGLRAAVARKLREENGLHYQDSEVVVSNGAKQSIWQAVLACCGPGDDVLIPAPYWTSYPEMARLAGANPVIVDTTPADGYKLTPESLRAALTPNSRVLILCTPSNPTGAVYTEGELRALADVVLSHDRLLVLSDEIYEHVLYAPATHVSFGALGDDVFQRTLTVNGFSKAFAMTGWRMGYLAAPQPFATATARIQSQTTSGASSIAQEAAVAALDLGPRGGPVVAEMVAAFEKRRDYCVRRIAEMRADRIALDYGVPPGAFYLLPNISGSFGCTHRPSGERIENCDDFCRALLSQTDPGGLAVVPGDAFGSDTTLRISYAASDELLASAMDRLARFVDDLA